MSLHPPGELYRQISFVSYYFHWELETVLTLPHRQRERFCQEISRINQAASGEKNLFRV